MIRLSSFKYFALSIILFGGLFSFGYPQSTSNQLQLTKKQWLEDIDFFARTVAKKHLNAFHLISKDQFDKQITDLKSEIDHLDRDQIVIRLFTIAASIGDVHTHLSLPLPYLRLLPIVIHKYDNDFRVVNMKAGFEYALGAKIVAVNGMPVADVNNRLTKVVTADQSPTLTPELVATSMRYGIILHGLGITDDSRAATYTILTAEGKEVIIDLKSDTAITPAPLTGISNVQFLGSREHKKGHLFVLIGPLTGSAAMSNTAHFRSKTEAILVGQAIGERPNGYAERRSVKLPNSRLELSYSVKIYNFVKGENIIRPDVEINPTLADLKSGIDPVIEWVLKQP
jgi:hypothetical protein